MVFADVNLALVGAWETFSSASFESQLAAGAFVISLISLGFSAVNTHGNRKLRKDQEARSRREQPALAIRVRDQYFETASESHLFRFSVEVANLATTSNSIKDARLVLVLGGGEQAGTFSAPRSQDHGSSLPVAVGSGAAENLDLRFPVSKEYIRANRVREYTLQVVDTFGTVTDHPVTVIQQRGIESGV